MSELRHKGFNEELEKIASSKSGKFARAFLQTVATAVAAVPGLGAVACLINIASSLWGESQQEKTNDLFAHCIQDAERQMSELTSVVFNALTNHNLDDPEINARVSSPEYQALIRRAFRDESTHETQFKREHLQKLLSNAILPGILPDDVVKIFIEWLSKYNDLHFKIAAIVRNCKGCTRLDIWEHLDGEQVREDSAEADLFANLIYDLSTGHVIRQQRARTRDGHFLKTQIRKRHASQLMKSRFDDDKGYELTDLGEKFIHYVMDEQVRRLT